MVKKLKNQEVQKIEAEGKPNEMVLTVDEVVAYTGYKKSYIYKLTHLRKIPHHKSPFGRKVFFSKTEIDNWALATNLLTVDQILNSNSNLNY